MPNHVRNYLTIVGPPADLDRFIARARGSHPRTGDKPDSPNYSAEDQPVLDLSFHGLLPLPKEFSEVPYGDGSPLSGYHMEAQTWGVKWGAYDIKGPAREAPERVTYRFTTAWSAPTEFLGKVAPKWPRLVFLLSWGGEGPTRGRARFAGRKTEIEEDQYKAENYPQGDDEAYKAAEKLRLGQHPRWVAREIASIPTTVPAKPARKRTRARAKAR